MQVNKGMFTFSDILNSLGGQSTEICFYKNSQMTLLLKDALGGNSYTVGLFFLNQGDFQGNLSSLRV